LRRAHGRCFGWLRGIQQRAAADVDVGHELEPGLERHRRTLRRCGTEHRGVIQWCTQVDDQARRQLVCIAETEFADTDLADQPGQEVAAGRLGVGRLQPQTDGPGTWVVREVEQADAASIPTDLVRRLPQAQAQFLETQARQRLVCGQARQGLQVARPRPGQVAQRSIDTHAARQAPSLRVGGPEQFDRHRRHGGVKNQIGSLQAWRGPRLRHAERSAG